MPNINIAILAGNLTRDPELAITPKGSSVCKFGIAINRTFKDASGTSRDETTFVDCEAWGKTAEAISKYLSKGRAIFINGRLKLDQWEDKTTGNKRSKLSVIVETFQFVDSKQGEHDPEKGSTRRDTNDRRPHMQDAKPAFDPNEDMDEDVPF